jgi:hypothetical protein
LKELKSDPARKVIFPGQAESDVANQAFKAARAQWVEASSRNRALLNAVEAELRQVRSER